MTAQAYFDDPNDLIVRIFDRNNKRIADLPVSSASPESADESLAAMKLQRRTKWQKHEQKWVESQVRFVR